MNTPPEIIRIQLDAETVAVITITVITEPPIPAPLEQETLSVPTARQLAEISRKLSQGKFTFA